MRKQGNDTNRPQVEGKKGKRRTLTVLGYALMIVFLLIVLPVVLPIVFLLGGSLCLTYFPI